MIGISVKNRFIPIGTEKRLGYFFGNVNFYISSNDIKYSYLIEKLYWDKVPYNDLIFLKNELKQCYLFLSRASIQNIKGDFEHPSLYPDGITNDMKYIIDYFNSLPVNIFQVLDKAIEAGIELKSNIYIMNMFKRPI